MRMGETVIVRHSLNDRQVLSPAIVTKVHSDECINCTAFPDGWSPLALGSVVKYDGDSEVSYGGPCFAQTDLAFHGK